MHLYTKSIESISWEDIEKFCERGLKENTYIEYKKDFPSDLAKTIAAMANTNGGLILIGVNESSEGIPILPVIGIPFNRGLEERVMNIILDNMSPPVIPEINACLNTDKDECIVVIRVPQSDYAPHVLHNNTKIYIRTNNRNKPEELADFDRIDWLRDRRKKSEELRISLFDRSSDRFRNMRDGHVIGVDQTDEGTWMPMEEQPGLLTIALCPLYPHKILKTPPELDKIRRDICVPDYMGTDHEFPIQGSGCINRMVEDGYVMHLSGLRGLRTYHTHLNVYGLLFYRQSLLYKAPQKQKINEDVTNTEGEYEIRIYEILSRLFEVVECGAKFFSEIGYWGQLEFRLKLEGILDHPLIIPAMESGRIQNYSRTSVDHEVRASNIINSFNLVENKIEIILPIFQKVGWTVNWHVTHELLKSLSEYMHKNKPF